MVVDMGVTACENKCRHKNCTALWRHLKAKPNEAARLATLTARSLGGYASCTQTSSTSKVLKVGGGERLMFCSVVFMYFVVQVDAPGNAR